MAGGKDKKKAQAKGKNTKKDAKEVKKKVEPVKPDPESSESSSEEAAPVVVPKAKGGKKDQAKGKEQPKGKGKKAPPPESSDSEDSSDDSDAPPAKAAAAQDSDSDSDSPAKADDSSDEEMEAPKPSGKRKDLDSKSEPDAKKAKRQDITLFVGNLPFDTEQSAVQEFFADLEVNAVRMIKDSQTGRPKGFCYVEFASEEDSNKALDLNGSDFNGRPIKIDVTSANTAGGNTNTEKSKTVFVGNLSWNTDEDSLRNAFGDCGTVASVRVITDRETGESKGFAYVEFEDQDGADGALELHGHEVDGRNIRVNYEGTKPGGDKGGFRGGRGGGRGGDRGGRGGRGGFDRGGRGGGRGGFDRGDRGGGFRGGRGGFDRGGRGGFDRGGRGGGRGGDRGGRGGRGAFQGKKIVFE